VWEFGTREEGENFRIYKFDTGGMVTMNGEETTAVLPAVAPTLDHSLDDDDDDVMSDGSSPQFDDSNDLMSGSNNIMPLLRTFIKHKTKKDGPCQREYNIYSILYIILLCMKLC